MISILELKDKRVILEKLEMKDGKKSKVNPGKIQEIVLSQNIITGYPVMKKRFSRNRDEAPRSVPGTSTVLQIVSNNEEEGLFKIETETSFYKVKTT